MPATSSCGRSFSDLKKRLLAVSDTWLTLLGYAGEEVIGRPILDFIPPALHARYLELWQELLRSEEAASRRERHLADAARLRRGGGHRASHPRLHPARPACPLPRVVAGASPI